MGGWKQQLTSGPASITAGGAALLGRRARYKPARFIGYHTGHPPMVGGGMERITEGGRVTWREPLAREKKGSGNVRRNKK